MRVLITCVGAYGHLNPLLPLASALASAGHDVAIATGTQVQPRATAAGVRTFTAGLALAEAFQQLALRFPDRPYERLAPAEIVPWYAAHLFGEVLAPAMLRDLQPIVQTWQPDLVVHDVYEFAAPVAAAEAGLPSISHTLGLRPEGTVLDEIAAAVAPMWQQHGLEPDPTAGVYRHLCLDIMPPSLQPAEPCAHSGMIRPLRPCASPPVPGERLPAWMMSRRPVPLVYTTLGTFTNSDVSMFRGVLDALAQSPLEVLLTVGPGNDPSRLGELPANAHAEQYVPQSLLLPECAVVICHAGAGTTLGALACGLPLLLLPQGADQYVISERVLSSGAGLCLAPADVTPTRVRTAVLELLHAPKHCEAARRVQHEIGAMRPPEQIVPLLEQLGGRAMLARRPQPTRKPEAGIDIDRQRQQPQHAAKQQLGCAPARVQAASERVSALRNEPDFDLQGRS